ncbi:hypothetical protein BX600DRAFT_439813 [Xylariales sp. PMI_506]|nr:hypothetical protein BX600DRAFT_439813 [Xylariales sp. PMI_506]
MKTACTLISLSLITTGTAQTLYKLIVDSGDVLLDGVALTQGSGGYIVANSASNTSPVEVFTSPSGSTSGDVSLFVWPITPAGYVLGLEPVPGSDTLANLRVYISPHSTGDPTTHWDNFQFDNGLLVQDLAGQWVAASAVDNQASIQWYSGTETPPDTYTPIEIIYEQVSS